MPTTKEINALCAAAVEWVEATEKARAMKLDYYTKDEGEAKERVWFAAKAYADTRQEGAR